jgi:hypothetical protein
MDICAFISVFVTTVSVQTDHVHRDGTACVSELAQTKFFMYVFFWVIPRRLNFISRRFGLFTFLPMKMEQIECSETSAFKIQTPGNHPEENIQHTEHGESLK